MSEYYSTMKIEKWLFDWCRTAFSIEMENEDKDWLRDNYYKEYDYRNIATCDFENGTHLTFDMISNFSEYWDKWEILFQDDISEFEFDSAFEITEGVSKIGTVDGDTYYVNIKVV